mmetsp:Transcript_25217/g.81550  ORF Transcript_25217/g.81550 Transcript_25217/m.81550 type:complete len:202 (+) Transcript_25217:2230-2835(+)
MRPAPPLRRRRQPPQAARRRLHRRLRRPLLCLVVGAAEERRPRFVSADDGQGVGVDSGGVRAGPERRPADVPRVLRGQLLRLLVPRRALHRPRPAGGRGRRPKEVRRRGAGNQRPRLPSPLPRRRRPATLARTAQDGRTPLAGGPAQTQMGKAPPQRPHRRRPLRRHQRQQGRQAKEGPRRAMASAQEKEAQVSHRRRRRV